MIATAHFITTGYHIVVEDGWMPPPSPHAGDVWLLLQRAIGGLSALFSLSPAADAIYKLTMSPLAASSRSAFSPPSHHTAVSAGYITTPRAATPSPRASLPRRREGAIVRPRFPARPEALRLRGRRTAGRQANTAAFQDIIASAQRQKYFSTRRKEAAYFTPHLAGLVEYYCRRRYYSTAAYYRPLHPLGWPRRFGFAHARGDRRRYDDIEAHGDAYRPPKAGVLHFAHALCVHA